ncbi:unnamed protein product [Zymoseptoria tritici ST99CH_3D1]|nr:unnamed protein product [Zymoseptoria tritici ST99CH_3D1]
MASSKAPTLAEAQKLNQEYELPNPEAYSSYQLGIYSAFRSPPFSTKPSEWERLAREKVPAANFGYVFGSASSHRTYASNIAAFDRYRLKPSMLVNATRRDLRVELFGGREVLRNPILVAPVGVQKIMHADAEEATARACKEVGVPMILSTAATRTIEEVATANGDGQRWYQLYWPRPQHESITASLLHRAKANGYTTLVVTLDTFTLAWRPTDLDSAYLPFLFGDGCQIGHSDPIFNAQYKAQLASDPRTAKEKLAEAWGIIKRNGTIFGAAKIVANARLIAKSRAWLDVMNSGTYREWSHLEVLKKLWDGPIVLKGIQTVEDARRAAEYGMSGIIVSNHGGRQLDGAIASLDALAEIAADEMVKASNMDILFDSGIRTGSDVLKALALGAKAVLVARPYMYGLAIGGQQGVEHVLRCLLADTDNSLANLGKRSIKDVGRGDLQIRGEAKL